MAEIAREGAEARKEALSPERRRDHQEGGGEEKEREAMASFWRLKNKTDRRRETQAARPPHRMAIAGPKRRFDHDGGPALLRLKGKKKVRGLEETLSLFKE